MLFIGSPGRGVAALYERRMKKSRRSQTAATAPPPLARGGDEVLAVIPAQAGERRGGKGESANPQLPPWAIRRLTDRPCRGCGAIHQPSPTTQSGALRSIQRRGLATCQAEAAEPKPGRLCQESERLPIIVTTFFNSPPTPIAGPREPRLGELKGSCIFVFAHPRFDCSSAWKWHNSSGGSLSLFNLARFGQLFEKLRLKIPNQQSSLLEALAQI